MSCICARCHVNSKIIKHYFCSTNILDSCEYPLGMESGEIKNSQIVASSSYIASADFTLHSPLNARLRWSGLLFDKTENLNKCDGWRPSPSDNEKTLIVYLGNPKNITGNIIFI